MISKEDYKGRLIGELYDEFIEKAQKLPEGSVSYQGGVQVVKVNGKWIPSQYVEGYKEEKGGKNKGRKTLGPGNQKNPNSRGAKPKYAKSGDKVQLGQVRGQLMDDPESESGYSIRTDTGNKKYKVPTQMVEKIEHADEPGQDPVMDALRYIQEKAYKAADSGEGKVKELPEDVRKEVCKMLNLSWEKMTPQQRKVLLQAYNTFIDKKNSAGKESQQSQGKDSKNPKE